MNYFRNHSAINKVIFDLDGTLYSSRELSRQIERVTFDLVAKSRGIDVLQAQSLVHHAKDSLTETTKSEPTLSTICEELGITPVELHQTLSEKITPEKHLDHDPLLISILQAMTEYADLYVYTNNNLYLTRKILAILGVDDLFVRLYTIEFSWHPKPNRDSFNKIIDEIGGPLDSFLFVGDRPDIDLKVPKEMGIPTLPVREVSDLLQIHQILGLPS